MTGTPRFVCAFMLACGMLAPLTACQNGLAGNESGTEPINDAEANDYKKAIVRCYKTGGTRVVKIMGELRCY